MFKLLITGLLCASTFISLSEAQCQRNYERKEFRKLSESERTKFFKAVKKLNEGDRPTQYDKLVLQHVTNGLYAHGHTGFLVWHRQYLLRFEEALQKIDPDVSLPFWNWSYDSQAPSKSDLLSKNYFGSNGNANKNNCVEDGVFSNWQVYYDGSGNGAKHCLRRKYDDKEKIGPFHAPEAIKAILDQSKTYAELRSEIEGAPHSMPHLGIGGNMESMASPNDPIFWLHHAYVDKIYYDWQIAHPNEASNYQGESYDKKPGTKNDILHPFNKPVGDYTDLNKLCYKYSDDGIKVQPVPSITVTSVIKAATSTSSQVSSISGSALVSGSVVPSASISAPVSSSRSGFASGSAFRSGFISVSGSIPISAVPSISQVSTSGSASRSGSASWSAVSSVSRSQASPSGSIVSSTFGSQVSASGSSRISHSGSNVPSASVSIINPPISTQTNVFTFNLTVSDSSKNSTGIKIPINAPNNGDREDPFHIRIPKPLPESWCKMNRLNFEKIKKQEDKLAQVISLFNQVNHISPASLCKRPDLASNLNATIPAVAKPALPVLPKARPSYTPPVKFDPVPSPTQKAEFAITVEVNKPTAAVVTLIPKQSQTKKTVTPTQGTYSGNNYSSGVTKPTRPPSYKYGQYNSSKVQTSTRRRCSKKQ